MSKYKVGDYVICVGGLSDPVEGAWSVKHMSYGKILEVDDSIGSFPFYTLDFGQENQYKCIVNQIPEESLAFSRESEFEKFKEKLDHNHTTFDELAKWYFELKNKTELE